MHSLDVYIGWQYVGYVVYGIPTYECVSWKDKKHEYIVDNNKILEQTNKHCHASTQLTLTIIMLVNPEDKALLMRVSTFDCLSEWIKIIQYK